MPHSDSNATAAATSNGADRDATTSEKRHATRRERFSVYVHFPYCLAKCPYCDFVSYAAARADIPHREYADSVLTELAIRSRDVPPDVQITSIFFGGGTPSLWDTRELGRVLDGIKRTRDVASGAEVTVECNPSSLDLERARGLRAVGVTRLSIGTQSLRADQLRFLGRLHDEGGALASIRAAFDAGFERISTDVIYGLPDQTPLDAVSQVSRLAAEGLRHLSCYQLTIEPGTQFGELAKRGRLPLADDGLVADSFIAVDDALAALGFRHYEISNFAFEGHEAQHNLSYWRGDEYLGLGCGAYGFLRAREPRSGISQGSAKETFAGVRYRNEVLPDRYRQTMTTASSELSRASADVPLDALPSAEARRVDSLSISREELSGEALLKERIMLGLRLDGGLDLDECARDLGVEPWTESRERALSWLLARERIERIGTRLQIPKRAWIWADDTAARLF